MFLQLYRGTDYLRFVYGDVEMDRKEVFMNDAMEMHVIRWRPNIFFSTKFHNHHSVAHYKVLQGTLYEYSMRYLIENNEVELDDPEVSIHETNAVASLPRDRIHCMYAYEPATSIHIHHK